MFDVSEWTLKVEYIVEKSVEISPELRNMLKELYPRWGFSP